MLEGTRASSLRININIQSCWGDGHLMFLDTGNGALPNLPLKETAMSRVRNTRVESFHRLFDNATECRWIVPLCHSETSGMTQHSSWGTFLSTSAPSSLLLGASTVLTGHSKTTEVIQVGGRPRLVTLTSTSLMRGLVHATPARHAPVPSPQQPQQDDWAYNPFLRPLREVEGCFRTTPEPCDTVGAGRLGWHTSGGRGTGTAAPGQGHLFPR